MSIRDIRRLQQQGYSDYTSQDEDFFKNVDPSFEAYKNYGVVADNRGAIDDAVQQAGGYYEAPDTTEKDLTTLGTLGTAAINYGKWEPYASSLLQKGFPKASFAKATETTVGGVTTTTYGPSGSSTVLGSAASQYYGNLTAGQATTAAVGTGLGTALVGYGIKKVFGDDDPTTYTAAEQIGTGVQAVGTAATIANIAGVALGPVGLAAAAFLGWRSGKRKQKKAIKQAQDRRQEEIAQIYEENRRDFGAIAKEQQYYEDRAMFSNPYGLEARNTDSYIPSYAHGGYHFNYQGLGTGQTGGSAPTGGGAPTNPPGTPSSSGSVPVGGGPTSSSPYTPTSTYTGPTNTGFPVPTQGQAPVTRSNYFSVGTGMGGYNAFLAGLPGPRGPIINQGEFVGGASQRSEVLENRGGGGDAGNFLKRTPSDSSDFYKKGEKGMKVAEVTGNEVIMPADRQNKIEKALASGDTETPGKIMKQTIAEGRVTKGAASHDSNPMPIMSSGAVLDKNGKDTGLKADNGAGIYHQANKQFKNNMSNKQISKAIKRNIASWKKQGKA